MLLGSGVGTLQEDVTSKLKLKGQMQFYLVKEKRNVERFLGKVFQEDGKTSVKTQR